MVEPLGGLLGAGIITLSKPLLPCGLAVAAGAILYVISHENTPDPIAAETGTRQRSGFRLALS
ncbi:hypothetical protein [Nisaea sp.]|uniref:hypothetical protein n=1 Tax=Nisaea sp. TaxID=2024842 RepID=UPI003B51B602